MEVRKGVKPRVSGEPDGIKEYLRKECDWKERNWRGGDEVELSQVGSLIRSSWALMAGLKSYQIFLNHYLICIMGIKITALHKKMDGKLL